MKNKRIDDGVFQDRQRLEADTVEDMQTLIKAATVQRDWKAAAREEAGRMLAYLRSEEDNGPKQSGFRCIGLWCVEPGTARHHDLKVLSDLFQALEGTGERAAFLVGHHLRELQIRLGSEYLRWGAKQLRTLGESAKSAGTKSGYVRSEKIRDAQYEYFMLYEKLKKSHTAWSDDQIFEVISTKHSSWVQQNHPGCATSKSAIRRAVKTIQDDD